jgi:hypothetical protein
MEKTRAKAGERKIEMCVAHQRETFSREYVYLSIGELTKDRKSIFTISGHTWWINLADTVIQKITKSGMRKLHLKAHWSTV